MCLHVHKTPRSRYSSILVKCTKQLDVYSSRYKTPYQATPVPDNGILSERDYEREYHRYDAIYGRHIHAYGFGKIRHGYDAYAINVKAYGYDELVCKFLYIPIADKSGLKTQRVQQLEYLLDNPSLIHWNKILKIFPKCTDYFKYNKYYEIDRNSAKAQKGQKNMSSNNVVNWSYMLNEEKVSVKDIESFASGRMSGKAFESLSTTARRAVRSLGATETRKRARKALARHS